MTGALEMLQNVARILVPGRLEGDGQTAPGPPKGAQGLLCSHTSNHAGVRSPTPVFLPPAVLPILECTSICS